MASLHFIEPETLDAEQARPLVTGGESVSRLQAPYFIDEHLRARLLRDPDFDDDILKRGGYRIFSTLDVACQTILEEELPRGLEQAEREWQKAKEARNETYLRGLAREGRTSEPREGQVRLARIRGLFDDSLDVEIGDYRGTVAFPTTSEGERRLPYFDPKLALTVGHLIDVRIDAIDRGARRMELAWYDTKHLQGAAALLDVRTGHILAMVGGADYYDMENAGMWNRATREGRQPGSAFKPLLYAVALDGGKTLGSIIMDDRIDYGGYVPRNYENRYLGPTTLYWALVESNNVVTVKLFKEIGFKRAFQGYRAFDILEPRPTWELRAELPTCLGSINATPLSIAAAYLALARSGIGIEPLCVTRVEDLAGRRLKTMKPRERQVVSPQSAFLTTAVLREATRNAPGRTGRRVGEYFDALEMPVPQIAGKTGTTTNCVDAWFVGYTPDLVLAVWVGFDRVRSLGPSMTGSRVAAPIWCDTMRRVLETRDDWRMTFEEPPGIVYRDISAETGALASAQEQRDGSTVFYRVPFKEGTEPNEPGEPYPGFPYWRHQHPDPDKNEISDPNDIPSHLYLPWASQREAPRYSPARTRALP
jgi:penicillin-binding protein 1A